MPISNITKLPEERILIVSYAGKVTIDEVRDGAVLVDQFRDEIGGGHVYGITDVREMEALAFHQIIAILKDQREGAPGTVTDPDYSMVFVGTSAMIDLYRTAMALPQNGSVSIPMFDNLEDAKAALQIMVTRDKNS